MTDREFDVCIFGATGFTGELVAEYFATKENIKWAIGGRSEKKLQVVAEKIGRPENMAIIQADSMDYDSLLAMTKRCKVICSTVGPFFDYGALLVDACVEAGTHYCDITGEYTFIYNSIEKNHEAAKEKGIRIVHCCGYDCIPVDMLAYLITKDIPNPVYIKALAVKANGAASGGTLNSGKGMRVWEKQAGNEEKSKDPYILAPFIKDEDRKDTEISEKKGSGWDAKWGTLTFPYFMAAIDNRLVRRSLALRGIYCKYDEALSIGLVGKVGGFALRHLPFFLGGGLSPKAGEGPSKAVQKGGSFRVLSKGEDANGNTVTYACDGKGDPGYLATSVLLGESALCLAFDKLPGEGGVLTPSTAMGDILIERLAATKRFLFKKV